MRWAGHVAGVGKVRSPYRTLGGKSGCVLEDNIEVVLRNDLIWLSVESSGRRF
jgi:hypothetical protein